MRTLYLYDSAEIVSPVPKWRALNLLNDNPGIDVSSDFINLNRITVFRFMEKAPVEVAKAAEKAKTRTLLWLRDQPRFDVIVAGQSRILEDLFETIRIEKHRFPSTLLPLFCIRFSDQYGGCGVGYDPSYLRRLGFQLDCPRDYKELFALLTFPRFIEAVDNKSWKGLAAAIIAFNHSFSEKPILAI